jgi:Protein of unknown function (DUF2950)
MSDARPFLGSARLRRCVGACFGLGLALALQPAPAFAQAEQATGAVTPTAAPAQPEAQQTFPTPEAAGQALVAALGKTESDGSIEALFGTEHLDDLRGSTDPVEWREDKAELHRAAKESLTVRTDAPDVAVLVLGAKAWPFPVPLVQLNGAWRFDTDAGVEEILNRRIGEHELEAIALLNAYVDAQVEYASEDRDGDEVLEYAQKLLSPTGTKEGLYWPQDGGDPSPFGEFVARASAAPYAGQGKVGDPYRGYYFAVLTKQGPNPPGGAYSYVINGNMIAGFALLALPAEYGKSGIMTFVVSHQGRVYQKDLGPKTGELARAIQAYDPDASWTPVEDEREPEAG